MGLGDVAVLGIKDEPGAALRLHVRVRAARAAGLRYYVRANRIWCFLCLVVYLVQVSTRTRLVFAKNQIITQEWSKNECHSNGKENACEGTKSVKSAG
ncbi:MAG: hypothetical protein KTU85_01005 [Acidimicrobiia bacterium]|nr:hypothetical protein [Acidimicrobiia bacterium]MCY4457755.1 hypothetical protein [Acidimicrobiaceae bacterium]